MRGAAIPGAAMQREKKRVSSSAGTEGDASAPPPLGAVSSKSAASSSAVSSSAVPPSAVPPSAEPPNAVPPSVSSSGAVTSTCARSTDSSPIHGGPEPLDVAASQNMTGESWRHWLACGSPREVLARIVHEDPLGVREHVALSLRDGAWLLDADRVVLRTFALIARHALHYRGRPEVDAWIRGLADDAIASLLREDAEAERRGPADRSSASSARVTEAPPDPESGREHGAAFAALARPLGLEPHAMGRACLAFNRLPQAERRAFHALVIAGRTLDEVARDSGESATDIARRARRALDAVLVGASAGGSVRPPGAVGPRAGIARGSAVSGEGETKEVKA